MVAFLGIASTLLGVSGLLAIVAGQGAYGVSLCAFALAALNSMFIAMPRNTEDDLW